MNLENHLKTARRTGAYVTDAHPFDRRLIYTNIYAPFCVLQHNYMGLGGISTVVWVQCLYEPCLRSRGSHQVRTTGVAVCFVPQLNPGLPNTCAISMAMQPLPMPLNAVTSLPSSKI